MKAKDFAKKLREMGSKSVVEQTPALEIGIKQFHESVEANFGRTQDSSKTTWPPHSPVTIAIHGPHPLLILTGAMKRAATGGSSSIRRYGGNAKSRVIQVEVDQEVIPYAGVHQFGSKNGKIPRRQYYFLHSADRPKLVADVRKKMIAAIKSKNRFLRTGKWQS